MIGFCFDSNVFFWHNNVIYLRFLPIPQWKNKNKKTQEVYRPYHYSSNNPPLTSDTNKRIHKNILKPSYNNNYNNSFNRNYGVNLDTRIFPLPTYFIKFLDKKTRNKKQPNPENNKNILTGSSYPLIDFIFMKHRIPARDNPFPPTDFRNHFIYDI